MIEETVITQVGDVPIKSRMRVRKFGEVYTPWHIVKKMCDLVCDDRLDTRYLEPACGNGNFLVEILRRKVAKARCLDDALIALSSIYGIDILPDNVREAKMRMFAVVVAAYPEDYVPVTGMITLILNCNVQQGDFLSGLKANGEPLEFVDWSDLARRARKEVK
jgi:hypothetical protein